MATVLKPSMSTAKINEYLQNGGEFTFKKGTYTLTKSLIVYSNSTVTCEEGVTFKRNHKGRMLQLFVEPTTTKYKGTHDVKWIGGTFIANTHTANANVIVAFHSKNVVFKDITVNGCVGLHSMELNASKSVQVINCKFLNQTPKSNETFREALQIDFANKDGLSISGAESTSPCYDGTHCTDITVSQCTFDNCPNGVGTHSISEQEKYHKNISISDCKFTNIAKVGIKVLSMSGVTICRCGSATILVNRLNTAHLLSGGKIDLPNYRYNSDVVISGMDSTARIEYV